MSDLAPRRRPYRLTRVKRDGWTPKRRETFLLMLTQTGCVEDAAVAAGMTHGGAYQLRDRDPEFAAAWRRAITEAKVTLEGKLIARAIKGDDIASTVKYPDRIAMFLLSRHDKIAPPEPDESGPPVDELCVEIEKRLAAIRARKAGEDPGDATGES